MKLRLSAIYVPPEDIGLPDTSTPNPNLMPMAVKEYFYQNGAISNYNQYMVCWVFNDNCPGAEEQWQGRWCRAGYKAARFCNLPRV